MYGAATVESIVNGLREQAGRLQGMLCRDVQVELPMKELTSIPSLDNNLRCIYWILLANSQVNRAKIEWMKVSVLAHLVLIMQIGLVEINESLCSCATGGASCTLI